MGPRDDIRLSFDQDAEVYDRARPSYPAELYDALFEILPGAPEVVEVGPGTGQATRDLLARGAIVHAVEIGPEMAGRLRSNLPSDRLRVTVGDFEDVEITAGSADAVFSATAYHWICASAQTDRPAHILRATGVVAIVDLIQVDSPEDSGFFAASQPIYERYGQGHTGPPAPRRDRVDPPMRRNLDNDSRFHSVSVCRFDWDQTYRAAEYRLLMRSYSGTQMMDPAERRGLLTDIETFIHREYDGAVTRPLVVTLTTAVLV